MPKFAMYTALRFEVRPAPSGTPIVTIEQSEHKGLLIAYVDPVFTKIDPEVAAKELNLAFEEYRIAKKETCDGNKRV